MNKEKRVGTTFRLSDKKTREDWGRGQKKGGRMFNSNHTL